MPLVGLWNYSDWEPFYPFMEMMARENFKEGYGKMICPHLLFEVQGLHPDGFYEVFLSIERFDNVRYTFNNGWVNSEKRKVQEEHEYRKISKGVKTGQQWMEGPISFEEARITNVKEHGDMDNMFYVTPMHKYLPVLYITEMADSLSWRFPIELAQFIPVTSYRNKALADWKGIKNKFTTNKNRESWNWRPQRDAEEQPVSDTFWQGSGNEWPADSYSEISYDNSLYMDSYYDYNPMVDDGWSQSMPTTTIPFQEGFSNSETYSSHAFYA